MSLKVLLVEDDFVNRRVIAEALELEGFDVQAAEAGEAALAAIDREIPELVVMDWRMPGLDGADLVQAIRARVTAPIVVVSAFAMASHRARILASGCDAYLPKPFSVDELASVIRQVAGRSVDPQTP